MHRIPTYSRHNSLAPSTLHMIRDNIIYIDDTDPSIQYSQGWKSAGNTSEYGHTTHGTSQEGAQATFTFSGSSVTVIGTIEPKPAIAAISTYSVDGADPFQFFASPQDTAVYQHVFYRSPPLNNSQHTLIITSLVSGSYYWLDYLQVVPNSINNQPPVNSPPASSSSTTSMSHVPTTTSLIISTEHTPTYTSNSMVVSTLDTPLPSIITSISQTSSSVLPSSISSRSEASTGAIAGGTTAGVLVLIIVTFLLWRRHRRGGYARHHFRPFTQLSPTNLGYVTRGGTATDKNRTSNREINHTTGPEALHIFTSYAGTLPPAGVNENLEDMPPPYR